MDEKMDFVPWGDIELFHNLVKMVSECKKRAAIVQNQLDNRPNSDDSEDFQWPKTFTTIQKPVVYRGKVKLHGSNGGVAIEGSHIKAQSRNQFIEKSGFGRIVFEKNENYFKSLSKENEGRFTIFGEYCGPKVQKGVALCQLKNDIFAVFAIDLGGELIIDPEEITDFMTIHKTVSIPPNVFVLPWHTEQISMDLNSVQEEGCAEALNIIESAVEKIDKLDPWVLETFGIEGPGEGLVLYPISLVEPAGNGSYKTLKKEVFKRFAFKAKGENHRVVVAKKSVQVNPTVAATVDSFVNLMCPEARLLQGVGEVGGYDMAKLKPFMDWVTKDVEKEGKAELEVSGLTWNQVKKEIGKRASKWYSDKVKGGGK